MLFLEKGDTRKQTSLFVIEKFLEKEFKEMKKEQKMNRRHERINSRLVKSVVMNEFQLA